MFVFQALIVLDRFDDFFVVGDWRDLHWGFCWLFGFLTALGRHSDIVVKRVLVFIFFSELDDFFDVLHSLHFDYKYELGF
jgi:hypothetical protein